MSLEKIGRLVDRYMRVSVRSGNISLQRIKISARGYRLNISAKLLQGRSRRMNVFVLRIRVLLKGRDVSAVWAKMPVRPPSPVLMLIPNHQMGVRRQRGIPTFGSLVASSSSRQSLDSLSSRGSSE